MVNKWQEMNLSGKLSYAMAGILFLVLPCVILSAQVFHYDLITPEHTYLFYVAAALFAAVAKRWKLFFGIIAGSLFLSTAAMAVAEVVGYFL